MYDTTPIGRAKFLCVLKEVMLQYVKTKANNIASNNNGSSKSKKALLGKINSMIIQWRTYLASIVNNGLLMNNAKVDEFMAMV